jgi:hypothetical protein
MSTERQPAKLASINMRNAVSEMQKNKVKVNPQTRTGLLSPNNVLQSRNKTENKTKTESQKVLEYMLAIREAMLSDTNKEVT